MRTLVQRRKGSGMLKVQSLTTADAAASEIHQGFTEEAEKEVEKVEGENEDDDDDMDWED